MAHYFDEHPTVASEPIEVTWLLPDGPLVLSTDRGVFGHGKVDTGTKLLLVRGPQPAPNGELLDLGCGTGAIALSIARRSPGARVWAVDTNARARSLCADNARRNGIDNVEVVAPSGVPASLRFDQIWSNPPIRIGKQALHGLLVDWFGRLQDDGEGWLAVQQHLGADSLQRWLTDHGFTTVRAASAAGFRILRSQASAAQRVDGDPKT